MTRVALLSTVVLLSSVASADTLSGPWTSPLGSLQVTQDNDRVVGAPRGPAKCIPPTSGNLLEGDLLEDSLSGQLFVCLSDCAQAPGWVPVLLLVAPDGKSLSGTSTIPKGCKSPLGRNGSLVLTRGGASSPAPKPDPKPAPTVATVVEPLPQPDKVPTVVVHPSVAPATKHVEPVPAAVVRESPAARQKAIALARDGANFQAEGKFEQARHRFLEAIDIDPLYAEGYNGVGVTFFARNDLPEALRWYKKSLGADPSFGDAYYNMACIYALQKRNGLALRYLRTAFHNGYTSRDVMRDDPDLSGLHGDAAFEKLLGEAQ